ncbi:MAG TPA: AtpZ/AtpI family protein [Anaerolineae bacterium]|nr:AtpZ/AtpI family protein [Anaerolineae bacterium]
MLAGVVGQVGCLTVLLITVALAGGIFLDNFLGSKPIFTILFTIGSVPITLYLIVRISLTAVERAQKLTAPPAKKETEVEDKSKG